VPVFERERVKRVEKKFWKIHLFTMLHSSGAAHLFRDESFFLSQGGLRNSNFWIVDGIRYQPLYEGKMFHQFDHRFAGVEITDNIARPAQPIPSTIKEHMNPEWLPSPRVWVKDSEIDAHSPNDSKTNYFLAYKDITAATNERTLLAAILPRAAIVDSVNIIGIPQGMGGSMVCLLLSNLNSFALDYIVRQKIGGTHIKFYLLRQLPMLHPDAYKEFSIHLNKDLEEWVVKGALELTFTGWDLKPFAQDCGYDGPPFFWD